MLHETLWQENRDLTQACLHHPFVQGLCDGELPREDFRRYVAQDAFYLDAFSRAYALALARSEGVEATRLFFRLMAGVQEELKLHEAYAQEMHIDLSRVQPNRACRAYTDFLLATAWHRSLGEILAAMTPCLRLYAFLGQEVSNEVGGPARAASHPYGRWIATYSAKGFHDLVHHIDSLLDRFASDTAAVRAAYRYAMQCELAFFSDAMQDPVPAKGDSP